MGQRAAAESYEARLERIRDKLHTIFAGTRTDGEYEAADFGVIYTFDDAVVIKDYAGGEMYEIAYAEVDGDFVFGEPQPVREVYVTKRLLEANPEMALKDVSTLIEGFDSWAGGTWAGCVEATKGSPGIENPEALCSWLHYQALGKWPGEKQEEAPEGSAKSNESGAELTGPIVMKNTAKRIAYAAVLVPGEPDHDGETVTKEKIEDVAHEWMELYQNVDLQHTLNAVGVPVESYVTPKEMTVKALDGEEMFLPEGTWILGNRLDEPTWNAVEKKELTGHSVMGMKRAALKAFQETVMAGKSTDGPTVTAALKKTLLRDLGDDWVPVYVSVVNKPAVPKAKFFALKAREEEPEPEEKDSTFLGRLKAAIGLSANPNEPAEKEGRRFAKATVEKLRTAAETLLELVKEAEAEEQKRSKTAALTGQKGGEDMNENEIKEMIAGAVKEAFQELDTKLTAIETSIKGEDEGAQEGNPDDQNQETDQDQGTDGGQEQGNQEDEKDDELETFKTEVNEKLDALTNRLGGTRSRALKGQDGGESSEGDKAAEKEGRDMYGRKRRNT